MSLAKELPLLNIKLKEGLVYPTPVYYTIIRYSINDILDSEFIEELKNVGLELREVQMFISPPNSVGKIHIDGHQLDSDTAAINFVLNNNINWEMQWFTINDLKDIEQLTSSGNTSYIPLTSDQCSLRYIFKSIYPFIVQIGVAHRVINLSNRHRYCISLRFTQNNFPTILKNANRYSTEI
jgi:DNA-binding transcriptional MerR regulator